MNTIKPGFFHTQIEKAYEKRRQTKVVAKQKGILIKTEIWEKLKAVKTFSSCISLFVLTIKKARRGRAVNMLGCGTKKRKNPERMNKYDISE